MINVIVIVVTVFTIGLVLLWFLSPNFRRWSEIPKYRMLEQDPPRLSETDPDSKAPALRPGQPVSDKPTQ